jgi:4-amino-4-deoxy-L-arabinose transferase-like glycosyltransferase
VATWLIDSADIGAQRPTAPATDVPWQKTVRASLRRDIVVWVMFVVTLAIPLALRLWVAGTLPLIEPTEGRYAQIALEMVESGDWVTPKVWIDEHQIPFLGKPPLYLWTAAISLKLFGATELAVRLPSLIAAAALLVMITVVVGRTFDRNTGLAAFMITSTCLLVFGTTATVIYDLHLTFFVTGALLAQFAFFFEEDVAVRSRWSLAVFVLLAGGFLTKGPVALALFGLPVLVWTTVTGNWHRLRHHRWVLGLVLFFALTIPWFAMAELRNPGFLKYFFVNENVLRYLVPEYGDLYGTGHQYPHGSAVWMFAGGTLPWSAVAAWWIVRRKRHGSAALFGDAKSLYFFVGFVSQVVFWSFARQLLPTYLLPAVPLFAIWFGSLVARNDISRSRLVAMTVIAANVWSLGIVAAAPVASRRTARTTLAFAHQIADRSGVGDNIVFVGKTPFSAGFYFDRSVTHHPREAASVTIHRAIDSSRSCLLVVSEEDVEAVPPAYRKLLRPLTSDGEWLFVVTRDRLKRVLQSPIR